MALVSDDYHAVQSASVVSVEKPDAETLWSLSLATSGGDVQLRFESLGARDDFFKKLVNAMES